MRLAAFVVLALLVAAVTWAFLFTTGAHPHVLFYIPAGAILVLGLVPAPPADPDAAEPWRRRGQPPSPDTRRGDLRPVRTLTGTDPLDAVFLDRTVAFPADPEVFGPENPHVLQLDPDDPLADPDAPPAVTVLGHAPGRRPPE